MEGTTTIFMILLVSETALNLHTAEEDYQISHLCYLLSYYGFINY